MRYIPIVIALALFAILAVLDVEQWIIYVSAGLFGCGWLTGILSVLDARRG